MSKSKKRREARRRARERQPEERPAAPPGESAPAEDVRAPEPQPAPRAHAMPAGRQARRKQKRRGGVLDRVSRIRVSPWLIAMPVLAGVIIFVVVGVMRGEGSGTTGPPAVTPTPDPRVAGQTPTESFEIQAGGDADDAFFAPSRIDAPAGEVIELVVRNTGTVTHNLRVSGLDGEYETRDDFEMPPNVIEPGETQRLLVKIDEPGSYPFRCDFHPLTQIGTLVLSGG